ncbi:MAG: phytoene desaturase [Bacteroidota bacterium]
MIASHDIDKGADKHAVVIGAGFGGLAIANRLQSAGMQVTLLEKRPKVGGRAYQFEEKGYLFDMGPSLITAPALIDDIFQQAGRSASEFFSLIPLDPYYRVYFHDGTYFDYSGDTEKMKAQMRKFNPGDADRYDDFMAAIAPIYDEVITKKLGAQPFDTPGSMLRFTPRALQLKAFLPVTAYVNRYFKDFRHRFMFSFHPLFIGGHPFRAPSIYLMIPFLERVEGVWFTKGGMYTVVDALKRLFIEQGGKLQTDAEVSEIVVENGKTSGVKVNNEYMPADVVVSNADFAHTYKHLIDARWRKKWTDKKLDKIKYSMSCFLLYLGVKKQFPELEHHTLILSERYKGLVDDIFDNAPLPDDFSMYVHAPTKSDPDMAPPGCESIYILIPVSNLTSETDWNKERTAFTDKVLNFLEAWGMDGLKENLEVLKIFTPLEFESELNAYQGNAFAIEPKLTQTAYFRPHNRSEDVDGLYFVGAGTHPGAGVPGVILSAEATAGCVMHDLKIEAPALT